jgi:O-antigen ligase
MATNLRTRIDLRRHATSAAVTAGTIAGLSAMVVAVAPDRYRALAVAGAVAPWLIVLAGDLERVLVAAILVDTWFDIDTNIGYRPDLAALGGVGGVSISLTTIAVLAFVFLDGLSSDSPAQARRSRLDVAVLVFAGLIAASAFVARDRTAALAVILPTIQCAAVYLILARWLCTVERLIFLVKVLTAAIFANAVIGCLKFAGVSIHLPGVATDSEFQGRFSGLLASPNTFGTLLALVLPVLVALLLAEPELLSRELPEHGHHAPSEANRHTIRFRQTVMWSVLAGFVMLIASQSRGSWLSVAVSGGVIAGVAWRRRWIPASKAFAAPLVSVAALLALPLVRDRIAADDHGSAGSRVPLMRIAGRMISDHPLFGVGANNYVTELPKYLTPDTAGQWIYTVHNQFALTWAESGIAAVAALIWLLLEIIRAGVRLTGHSRRILACIGIGVAAAVCGHAAHMTIEIMNGRQQLGMLLVLAALVRSAGTIARQSQA